MFRPVVHQFLVDLVGDDVKVILLRDPAQFLQRRAGIDRTRRIVRRIQEDQLCPAARFSAILAVMAWVADGVIFAIRLLSTTLAPSSGCGVSRFCRRMASFRTAAQALPFSASRSRRVFRKYRTMSMVTMAMSAK